MEFGLVHIRYSDKRLWAKIMSDMNLFIDDLLGYSSGQRGLTVDGSA
jgi:hypothetical protein